MKILFVGDIVGNPGRRIFHDVVKELKETNQVQLVIANGENAAGGNGITVPIAQELTQAGADVITLGDHTWGQRELEGSIGVAKNLVRPLNYQQNNPGQGWVQVQTPIGPFIVVNLQGQVFMGNPVDNPFHAMDGLFPKLPRTVPILVDFHAEASSEKIGMGYYLDGRVAAVVGTHTHTQTNDAQILPKGTAYISDLGMTGAAYSVLGREVEPVLKKFTTGIPAKFEVAKGPCKLEGAIVDFDRLSGRAVSITAYRYQEAAEQAE